MTVTERIAKYEAARDALIAKLEEVQLGGIASASEGGRSVTVNLQAIRDQIKWYDEELSRLGQPQGTLYEPFVIISRTRP